MMRWKFSSPRLTATQFALTRGYRFDAQAPQIFARLRAGQPLDRADPSGYLGNRFSGSRRVLALGATE
jgi:hypothetical protein